MITVKQLSVLTFIREYTEKHKYPPTIRDIRNGMGYKSTNAAWEMVDKLEKCGYVKRQSKLSRSIVIIKEP